MNRHELAQLMVEVANERFGVQEFRRRDLKNATEQEVRTRGFWIPADDVPSNATDRKSLGLANIDYRVSDLAKWGSINTVRHTYWIDKIRSRCSSVIG